MDKKLVNLDLIVFDLDYTLWPFWVDTHVTPPFRKDKNGGIVDARGQKIKIYPEVPEVLQQLSSLGYKLGVASRTSAIQDAHDLVQLLGWEKYFANKEIYPGRKMTHFDKHQKKLAIPLDRMLFFDDEHRNIQDLEKHGVVSILVENGVNKRVIEQGLNEFKRRRAAKENSS